MPTFHHFKGQVKCSKTGGIDLELGTGTCGIWAQEMFRAWVGLETSKLSLSQVPCQMPCFRKSPLDALFLSPTPLAHPVSNLSTLALPVTLLMEDILFSVSCVLDKEAGP